jgi:hypothetical protein
VRRIQELLAAGVASTHGLLRLTVTVFAVVFVAMFMLGAITGDTQPGIGWAAIASLVWFYGLWLVHDRAG